MATRRIKEITNTATTFASDDFIALDGTSQGTRKMDKDDLISQVSAGVSGDYLEEANNLSDVASLDTSKLNMEIPDVGTAPNEVPLNGQLGSMAYQSADSVAVAELEVESATGTATTQALTVTDGSSTKFVVQEDGRTGINNSSPGTNANSNADDLVVGNGGEHGITIYSGSANNGRLFFSDGTGSQTYRGIIRYDHSSNSMTVGTNSTDRLTIDSSGNVNVSSGQIQVISGAVSAPSYAFDGDTDTGMSRPTTNAINFVTGGTERWRINASGNLVANGTAIDFGSVAGGTGTPDTTTGGLLDDFETGSFSPTFTTTGTGFTTVTVNYTNARYTKVGNCVTFSIFLKTSEIDATGATGNLCISGLPFTARSDLGNYSGAVNVGYAHLWANAPEGGYVGAGATRIQLTKRVTSITGSLSECVPTDMSLGINTNWNQIMVSGHYYTA